jgi:hypothetical protein
MRIIECKGTPSEVSCNARSNLFSELTRSKIGFQHGKSAKTEVKGSIAFYASVFQEKSNKSWPQVRETASTFALQIKQKWPAYYQEMQGLATGAEVDILDIVALNVRTEIAFGQFSDGCTAMAQINEKRSFLGQNWDVSKRYIGGRVMCCISFTTSQKAPRCLLTF